MYGKGHDTLLRAPSTTLFTEFNYSIGECSPRERLMSAAGTRG